MLVFCNGKASIWYRLKRGLTLFENNALVVIDMMIEINDVVNI